MKQGKDLEPFILGVADGQVGGALAGGAVHNASACRVGHVNAHDGRFAVVFGKQSLGGLCSHADDDVDIRILHQFAGLCAVNALGGIPAGADVQFVRQNDAVGNPALPQGLEDFFLQQGKFPVRPGFKIGRNLGARDLGTGGRRGWRCHLFHRLALGGRLHVCAQAYCAAKCCGKCGEERSEAAAHGTKYPMMRSW